MYCNLIYDTNTRNQIADLVNEGVNMTTFISYSRTDSAFVVRLAKDLKAAGIDVWVDQLDIPKGTRWDDEIEAAVEKSSTFMIASGACFGRSCTDCAEQRAETTVTGRWRRGTTYGDTNFCPACFHSLLFQTSGPI